MDGTGVTYVEEIGGSVYYYCFVYAPGADAAVDPSKTMLNAVRYRNAEDRWKTLKAFTGNRM